MTSERETAGEGVDELMIRHVRKDRIAIEGALYTGKWFDYRFMTPVEATRIYAVEFEKAYRASYRHNVETRAAPFIRIFKTKDLFREEKGTISGIWRGRQIADAMGIPYGIYLTLAFKARTGWWQQKHLPRPTQLYSDLVTEMAAEAWEKFQDARLFYSTLPQYRNENYAGLAAQNDHHEWLLLQAAKRGGSPATLADMVYGQKILLDSKVRARFGDTISERIREYAEQHAMLNRYN
jgi:hypothetical protein